VWHASFICVPCLIHMCDMPHSYLWHASRVCVCAWHDSSKACSYCTIDPCVSKRKSVRVWERRRERKMVRVWERRRERMMARVWERRRGKKMVRVRVRRRDRMMVRVRERMMFLVWERRCGRKMVRVWERRRERMMVRVWKRRLVLVWERRRGGKREFVFELRCGSWEKERFCVWVKIWFVGEREILCVSWDVVLKAADLELPSIIWKDKVCSRKKERVCEMWVSKLLLLNYQIPCEKRNSVCVCVGEKKILFAGWCYWSTANCR